jgi:DNA polymerase-1
MGRRLYLPQINAKNKMLQQHALRTAINAPMQGSSADIIKKAMLDVDAWIGRNNPDIDFLNMQNANTNIEYCVSILTSP